MTRFQRASMTPHSSASLVILLIAAFRLLNWGQVRSLYPTFPQCLFAAPISLRIQATRKESWDVKSRWGKSHHIVEARNVRLVVHTRWRHRGALGTWCLRRADSSPWSGTPDGGSRIQYSHKTKAPYESAALVCYFSLLRASLAICLLSP